MSKAGEPNYITPEGAKKLQEELVRLRTKDRPKIVQDVADAAAQGDRSENAEYIYGKRKLREIDRRMHFLTKRLEKAQVVRPREDGEDEIDLEKGHISWRSPLGRALLKKEEGDSIVLHRPSGPTELTVVSVRY